MKADQEWKVVCVMAHKDKESDQSLTNFVVWGNAKRVNVTGNQR